MEVWRFGASQCGRISLYQFARNGGSRQVWSHLMCFSPPGAAAEPRGAADVVFPMPSTPKLELRRGFGLASVDQPLGFLWIVRSGEGWKGPSFSGRNDRGDERSQDNGWREKTRDQGMRRGYIRDISYDDRTGLGRGESIDAGDEQGQQSSLSS